MKLLISAIATSATIVGGIDAQTLSYADVTPTGNTVGSEVVVGTLGGVSVTYNGSNAGDFQDIGNLNGDLFATSFTSWSPALDGTEDIYLEAAESAGSDFSFLFSQTIWNPVIYFGNLGNADGGALTFRDSFTLIASSGITQTGQTLTSSDNNANGVVQFAGEFTSLAFEKLQPATSTASGDQIFLQVGFDAVPEPSSAFLFGLGALGFLGRRKR